ncbi:type I CRISPR-associated protein Cas7 [Tannerella sp.]|uniref:type I CRISPR-associated protein Cas7 n=1 Tax=Tannerella sp. TaxID=2382127 RepID=UPI003FA1AEEB
MSEEVRKSEILFLYESSYNIPNGDPFTGEQRYDEETKKILVSDVRMKRYVRTYLEDIKKVPIYVSEKTGAGKTDSKGVLTWIAQNRNPEAKTNFGELLKEQTDVRLFGGISTLDDKVKLKIKGEDGKEKEVEFTNGHVQFTGPVQFALLNPSLNEVNLRMHQNTTHFTSKAENTQGSIGTTTLVPYSLIQIHGWVNPKVAETTGMTSDDLKLMYEGLWYGTSGDGSSHSRSKVGQNSVLLLEIVYDKPNQKIYGVDRLITLIPKDGKKGEQLRSMDDYDLNFDKLIEIAKSDKVLKIKYYTELQSIKDKLKDGKFEIMTL